MPMLTRLRLQARDESGWSLVEVLVAMLILGLITAIAVPSFANQRKGGDDATTKALARAGAAAMEAYVQENLGAYDGITDTKINQIDPSIPVNQVDVTGFAGCPASFYNICYLVDAFPAPPATGTHFYLAKLKDGTMAADCDVNAAQSGTQHGTGGCPADGDWDN